MKRISNLALAALVLLSIQVFCLPAYGQEEIDTSRKCDKDARVTIENVCGSITLIGWDREEIQVRGELGDDVEEFVFDGDADDVEVRVIIENRHRRGWFEFNRHSDGTHLEIHLPVGCEVRVGSVSADVEASDLSGNVEIETVSGEISVDGKMKELEVESISGEIELDVESEELRASTVSGEIILNNGSGGVTFESVSGELEIDGGAFTDVEFETVSGEIRFDGKISDKGSIFAESHSGEILLILPENIEADFDLSTLSGDIDSDFGPSRSERRSSKRSFFGGREMSFSTGSGSITIELETFSGDIVIEGR